MARIPTTRIPRRLTSRTRGALLAVSGGLRAAFPGSGHIKSKREFDAEAREIDLEEKRTRVQERRFRLMRQKVYLGLTIASVVATVAFATLGVQWSVPVLTGGSGALAVLAELVDARRSKRDGDRD